MYVLAKQGGESYDETGSCDKDNSFGPVGAKCGCNLGVTGDTRLARNVIDGFGYDSPGLWKGCICQLYGSHGINIKLSDHCRWKAPGE